ncbi:hypothetical protein LTR84_008791 [Exophiala bonariae]|uniref:Fe/B12 periplasmic-binding domain-containing protein n=1 Tax=Exophiala bonariae TaxID=1690606 RepID=A0AAV9N039_9EURO|nr:hypothetical protein LTR84_008791 [Exophiala bonariae]
MAGIEDVHDIVQQVQPDVLFCASMWTEDESKQIQQIARNIIPNIRTYAVPHGMQVAIGPDATVEHVKSKLVEILSQEN